MPITFIRKLHPTGHMGGSRALIVPKEWWSSPKEPIKRVKMIVDKSMILSPEKMPDSEIIECVLFILKQQYSKEEVMNIFQRVFGIEIVKR